jgi:O-acetyl-ADP-ribose deacetylase (regulator of RNase III)
VWHGGGHNESVLLRACYENSFALARQKGLKRIAFPAISTGIYGYPKQRATAIALVAMHGASADFNEIIACCFSREDAELYASLCHDCDYE